MIEISDFNEARALVLEGDIAAEDVRDSHSAILLRDAFQERLDALGDCHTCAAIEEGKFLVSQIEALDCDFGDEPAAECMAHLY